MHNPEADLHTFQDVDVVLVHPHTANGYGFLVRLFTAEAMEAYERDEGEPMMHREHLAEFIERATREGLVVEQTASLEVAGLGLTEDRRN